MAYNAKQLARQGGAGFASGNVKSHWIYASADTLAAIAASGYFNSATNRLNHGDIIEVIAGVGGTLESGRLQVTSAKAAATVTTRASAGSGSGVVNHTAGATLTAGANGNRTNTLNAAAGQAIVLPAATGSGDRYRFFVGTTITSNSTTIKVANAADTMRGNAIVAQDGGDTVVVFEAGATADTITLNGTTTGGLVGDWIELEDVAANMWSVRAVLAATGTEATPFSATVS
jgi:hypothetical protein